MKCSICNFDDSLIKKINKSINIKGKNINYSYKHRVCNKCGQEIYDKSLEEENQKEINYNYLLKIGLEPKKIIDLRKKYGISQELFAKIIGCAKKTLISYEKGTSIPNDIYLIVLKTLYDNQEVIKYMIESNKENFTLKEYEKIEKNIYKKDKIKESK